MSMTPVTRESARTEPSALTKEKVTLASAPPDSLERTAMKTSWIARITLALLQPPASTYLEDSTANVHST